MDEQEKTREELLHEINALRLKFNSPEMKPDSSVSHSEKDKEAILQSEEKYRLLIDLMPEGIYKVSKERRFLEVNPALVNILGYDRKEEILSISDVLQLYFTEEESEKALAGRKAEETTVFRLRRKDGAEIWVEDHGRPVFDDQGNLLFYEGVLHDITERKQAEKKLKNQEARFAKMLTHIGDVVFIVDREGVSKYLSPNLEKLFGWKPCERVGHSIWEVVHPDDQVKVKAFIENMDDKYDFNKTLECRYICKDGSVKWIEILASDFSHDPDIDGFLGSFHDITRQKQNREKLVELKEKAEESDHLKSAFLANMSHEIRTPLNGIVGFIDLLSKPNIPEKQREQFTKLVKTSSDRLISTIDDILGVSKIDTGQCEKHPGEIEIDELLKGLYGFFQPYAAEKGLSLQIVENPHRTVRSFSSDKGKLESILSHFIKNAIKFTEEGFVKFGVKESGNQLVFFVTDSGIGIPREKQEVIFDRFSQVNMDYQRQFEGSGLGLSIAEGYCDILGGKMWVESQMGQGSTFYFALDYEAPFEDVVPRQEFQSLNEKSAGDLVLVAEDDEASFVYLEEVLTMNGFRVIHASNGEVAVRLARENPEIGLILMDVKMPVLNGCEATKQIKAFNASVPVVAQTAYANPGELEKMKLAGCDDYLTKPIHSEEVLKCVFEKFGM